jgi:PAS domain S-box-containing protein
MKKMTDVQTWLETKEPGMLLFGGARMALLDVESGFWGLRRQLEALAGLRLTNAALQQAGANGGASFARAFVPHVAEGDEISALRDCIAAFEAAGFGRFKIESAAWPLGRVVVRGENTFEAWMQQQHNRRTSTPICAYSAGVLVGFINVLAGRRDIVCVEHTCQACGDDVCRFELLPAAAAEDTAVVAFDPDPFLSQQLDLLSILFDQMPMGIAILDPDYRLRRFNPTWAAFIAQYTPSPASKVAPGVSIFDLEPGTEAVLLPILNRILAGETVRQNGVRLETGGIVSYWDVLLTPLHEDGRIAGILDVSLDATERVLAEQRLQTALETLQRSEERLKLALHGATDGIWDWDLATGEIYFSPRWKSMLGYAADELSNQFDTWRELIHPDDREQTLAMLQAHLDGKQESYRVEHRLRHKDGFYRWILARGAAVRDAHGRPVRMAGSHTDITQRRAAQAELQRRIAFEKIITTISNNFINMPPDEIDQGIERALQTIGAFTGADRAYIFRYADDGLTMSCTQEWCAEGTAPQIERLQAVPTDALAWSNAQLRQGQALHIPRVADLPPEAAAEKTEFQGQGIQSLLAVPMAYQEKVVGFLGFDGVRQEMTWTAVSISLLQIVGEIFVNALEHKRSRAALQAANRLLEQRVAERTQELERRNQELVRQRQGAEGLRAVLALLNSNRPLPEVLEAITRQASELMGPETAVAIFQYDPSRERFELRASHLLPDVLRQTPSVPVSAIGGEAFKQRQLLVVPDLARYVAALLPTLDPDEPELIAAFETLRARFCSYLAVPLVVHDMLYGGIAFHFTAARALDEEDVTLASTLSAQAALAIENARLYALEQERREIAEGLRDVLGVLNSNRPLLEILDYIITQAGRIMGAEIGLLYRADYAKNFMFIEAQQGLPAAVQDITGFPLLDTPLDQRIMARQAVAGPIDHLVERQPFTGIDPAVIRRWHAHVTDRHDAFLAIPLVVRDAVYGRLTFYYARNRAFSQEDIDRAMLFGDQVALAIENARLVESERRRREESERRRQVAEGLRDILARLNSEQSLPELLDAIVAQADRLIDSDVVALYLLHEESQKLTIQAQRGDLPPEVRQVELPLGVGTIGRVVATRQPMIVPDVSRLDIQTVQTARAESLTAVQAVVVDEQHMQALAAAMERFQAVLGLPLAAQDVAYGGLAFYYSRPREFSDEEVSLATTFAGQAALAIQNARLRDHAEQMAVMAERNRLARELHDAVTQTLFSASLIADVLPRLWERSPQVGQAKLAELRELTRGALAEMRTLLLELRPATLTESSLAELLKQLRDAVVGRSRLVVELAVTGERPLSPDVQIALYRIAQEALNNVIKHAGATRVALSLAFEPEGVILRVSDNGRGFQVQEVGVHSLGLGIMRERAAKIDAELRVESVIGEGTTVTVQASDKVFA